MLSQQQCSEYSSSQGRLADDYTKRAWEAYVSYQREIDEIAADARNKSRLLSENYYATLQAASSGDDAIQRADAARLGYQREYTELNGQYVNACGARYSSYLDTLQELQATIGSQSLDNYIGLMQAVKKEFGARPAKAASKPQKSTSSGGKNG